MKTLIAILFAGAAWAQVGQETLIPGTPPGGIGGACLVSSFGYLVPVTQGSEIVLCDPTSHLWTVTSGGGSGSCGALAGDVTGTCAANVVSTISTSNIALPGNPTTTTQSAGNNSTRIATTAFVTTAAGAYLPLAGGTMTGNILFTDNTYDIGATGATRPRNIFLSNAMTSVSAKLTGLAGGGTQCVTVDNTGALGASGATCSNSVFTSTFTAQTSITMSHNFATNNLTFACYSAATPPVWIEPNTVTQTDTNTLTVTFTNSQSGHCTIVAQGGPSGGGGISGISVTAPITSSGGTTPTIGISNFTGDSGSGGAAGAVPAPAAGDAAAAKYLKADGTWATVSSGSTTVTNIFITNHGNHTTNGAVGTEYFSSCDATGGNVTLTLPSSPTTGELHNIKRKDGSGNLCIIDGNGKSIDGGSSVPMTSQYLGISVYYDGTQWWVI